MVWVSIALIQVLRTFWGGHWGPKVAPPGNTKHHGPLLYRVYLKVQWS